MPKPKKENLKGLLCHVCLLHLDENGWIFSANYRRHIPCGRSDCPGADNAKTED